ncbi:hypothetical protein PZ938_14415 [Luteipulveratus sp. YIM 133132]|uniref:hypothetical protein n=1 Tax=Luteipulveratus flavus TaxID=3031728 RepID=UPI0023B16789|nr:hypothetical protein [Luteipulveratus sp. YIM 133132]MDE9366805.1 hypothetical protein [Luteipulveratus sp. YIM 133132]
MNPTTRVQVRRLHAGLPSPTYARPGDGGADLYARACVRGPGHPAVVEVGSLPGRVRGETGHEDSGGFGDIGAGLPDRTSTDGDLTYSTTRD